MAQEPCAICAKSSGPLCHNCATKKFISRAPSCFLCNSLSARGKTCETCRRRSNLTGVVIVWRLEGVLKNSLHNYKYDSNRDMAGLYARMISKSVILPACDIVSFVPSDGKAIRARGFDHNKVLARAIANQFDFPLTQTLVRVRHKRQVGHNRRERFAQVRNNFALSNIDVRHKKVLLIDDVLTTGATLDECARMLRIGGARQVWGLVLAKK